MTTTPHTQTTPTHSIVITPEGLTAVVPLTQMQPRTNAMTLPNLIGL